MKYLGPVRFEGRVNRVAVEDLFTAPNSGENLGSIVVTSLFYVQSARQGNIILPDASFIPTGISRTLSQYNRVEKLSRDNFDEPYGFEEKIKLSGSLLDVDTSALELPTTTSIDFGKGFLNIRVSAFSQSEHSELWGAVLDFGAQDSAE